MSNITERVLRMGYGETLSRIEIDFHVKIKDITPGLQLSVRRHVMILRHDWWGWPVYNIEGALRRRLTYRGLADILNI